MQQNARMHSKVVDMRQHYHVQKMDMQHEGTQFGAGGTEIYEEHTKDQIRPLRDL